MSSWISGIAISVIGIVIYIVIATSLGPTVITSTATGTGQALENASATGKTMYSLVELLYPILIVISMISVGFAAGKKT
jgi:hypothetical protein